MSEVASLTQSTSALRSATIRSSCPGGLGNARVTATVLRNAVFHTGPGSSSTLAHMSLGTTLTLLDPQPTTAYYRLQTEHCDQRWIWSHNIKIDADTSTLRPTCDATLRTTSIMERWRRR